ncbi:MAG TPA: DeoR/GlpR family DNA-binding transcription regulator [Solirubrobacteraceae bacterium]|nr:DeoR/GlpR family DNA-binding transcription regulator [Solirubrobacteraceae bacterium]
MLVAERRDLLLRRLETDGKLVARDLASELGVSEDSVRRDLRDLASAGRCQRVYGGAVPVSRALVDYSARASVEPESKQRVAARAAALINSGDRVILDGGTTTLAVVRAIPTTLTATVITHSPTIAAALVDHPGVEILLLGGRIYKHSAVACGAITVEAAAGISADLFLLGVTGVHPEAGLTTGDAEEAAMKRTLAGRAADTYALASTEKLGAVSAYKVLGLSDVTAVLTDAAPKHPVVAQLRDGGTTVLPAG